MHVLMYGVTVEKGLVLAGSSNYARSRGRF